MIKSRQLHVRTALDGWRLASAALLALLAACSSGPANSKPLVPTYDPFVPLAGTPGLNDAGMDDGSAATRSAGPTPTRAPISVTVPVHSSGEALATPTPNPPQTLPTVREQSDEYVVQTGDTLASIAEAFGVSVELLRQSNGIANENLLAVGTTLKVPPPAVATPGPSFKIIPAAVWATRRVVPSQPPDLRLPSAQQSVRSQSGRHP